MRVLTPNGMQKLFLIKYLKATCTHYVFGLLISISTGIQEKKGDFLLLVNWT